MVRKQCGIGYKDRHEDQWNRIEIPYIYNDLTVLKKLNNYNHKNKLRFLPYTIQKN